MPIEELLSEFNLESWSSLSQPELESFTTMTCYKCHKPGHRFADCKVKEHELESESGISNETKEVLLNIPTSCISISVPESNKARIYTNLHEST
jgi:hypothetical protein